MVTENIYTFHSIAVYPNVIHGISTRSFGSMKDKGVINHVNLQEFLTALHVSKNQIVLAKQIHSGDVFVANDVSRTYIEGVDGFITARKNIYLGIVTADCLQALFYDKKRHIVGIAHAGYKGIVNHIVENMIDSFKKSGSDPKDIIVGIGPGIGVCCYDVPFERIEMFQQAFPYATKFFIQKNGKYFLDLKELVYEILLQEGIAEKNIEISDICTSDRIDLFYSYRKEGEKSGRFMSVIGIK